MQAHIAFPLTTLEVTIHNILTSRRITRQDQHMLMHLGMQVIQDKQALNLLNSVFDALKKGLVRVVD